MMKALKALFAPRVPAARAMTPEAAVAALLVEAALVDGVYVNIESDMIAEILLDAFGLDAVRCDALLAEAEARAEGATGSHEFTKHAKKLAREDRLAIVETLYRVVFADGEKTAIEDAYVRHVAGLLHIDDVARAGARQRAEARGRSAAQGAG